MRKFGKSDEAFTGLEAAIVLIAFVVVAAVFSYVMLGAGFFTSQKSQEVVHTGVEQASASIEIRGDVYGWDKYDSAGLEAQDEDIDVFQFTVGLTAGGSAVDMKKVVLNYATQDDLLTISPMGTTDATLYVKDGTPTEGKWMIIRKSSEDTDTGVLLEPGEQFVLSVRLPNAKQLDKNTQFNLELKPVDGSALGIKRTSPPQIDELNTLY